MGTHNSQELEPPLRSNHRQLPRPPPRQVSGRRLAAVYQDLKQPDNPSASCCGEADAYWADAFEATSNGEYVAIITDPRDDKPLGRIHRDMGTRIVVPKNKIKWNEGNPVGHGIIFLSRFDNVFCYLPPLGM